MNKIYPFTTPGNYTYDSDKIIVEGGLAKLKEDLTNVYARYHLNEATGATVLDTSGNSRDGTPINSPVSVTGKLNNGLSFNGTNQYVNLGQIASFEYNDPFSLEFWIKTSFAGNGYILTKALLTRGWICQINGGKIGFALLNSITKYLGLQTNNVFNNDILHHVIISYNGSHLASGVKIYVDNNLQAVTITKDTLGTNTIINAIDCQINGYNGANTLLPCLMDEIIIYDKELIQSEVTYKWNSGAGRENWYYYSDKPTIEPTDLFDPATVLSWDSFLETLGGGNEGSVGYNLYKVDKTNKYYWDGAHWVTGGDSSHYNSQAVVNENISAFDASPDKIGFIAYLISDGEQAVELDENQITFTVNIPPFVNAGSNKSCKDNETISPFSDCNFYDDGTIDYVYCKVDGEVDTWSQIPKGGYGTLLEAVKAFPYQFANLGVKTVRLRVEDNEGAKSEDSLEVTVSKYEIIFNVKDALGNHVSDFNFIAGDTSAPQLKSSPFTYEYEYKATPYNAEFNKEDYISATADVASTDHTENIILSKTAYIETSRIYHPIRIDIKNKKSIIKEITKGDTILFEVKVELNLENSKIRAELWDDETIDITKANSDAGGNDFEIEVTDVIGGVFIIKINEGETTNIANTGWLEIEIENQEGKLWTVYRSILNFVSQKII